MELKKVRADDKVSHNQDGTVTIRELVVTDEGDEEERLKVVSREMYAAMSGQLMVMPKQSRAKIEDKRLFIMDGKVFTSD